MFKKLTTEQFIIKARLIHEDKYDYSLVNYINNSTEVIIICPIHGPFKQTPNHHLAGYGCSFCAGNIKKTTEDFIREARLVHGDAYDYSLVDYKNNHTKVKIICRNCGKVFEQKPVKHINKKQKCPYCSPQKFKPKSFSVAKTTEQFIKEAIAVHRDKYDYSLVVYKDNKTKVEIICKKCGNHFYQTPKDHLRGYGCIYCSSKKKMTIEEFVKRAVLVHGDKYDYSSVEYINSTTKVKIICRNCGKMFEQTPQKHLQNHGCPFCSGIPKKEQEQFIQEAVAVHKERYDYSLVKYVNYSTPVEIICKKCNRHFWQTPGNHLSGTGCPYCRESKGEKAIFEYLTEHNIDFKRQHKFPDCKNINPLPFDFYLPEYNTCVEFDGIQHFEPSEFFGGEEGFKNLQVRDAIKNQFCSDNNIKLIRIKYDENIEKKLNEELLWKKL